MNLNNEQIAKIDLDDMQSQIASLYSQIENSIEIMNEFKNSNNSYKNIISKYNKILIIGMGGSAIGADFARTIIQKDLTIPIVVLRDYSMPNWVDKNTFVIVSSYSGNTEETLAAYNKCLNRGCKSIVISTGGELSKIALKNNTGIISLPKGYQPRAAIGYSLSIMLLLFEEIGLVDYLTQDLIDTYTRKIATSKKQSSLEIAEKMYGKFPIIYSSGGFMEILSIRLKGQLAENSKILSYYSIFPEHNHNEIEGWNNKVIDNSIIIWIKDDYDKNKIKNRLSIVSDLINDFDTHQINLDLSGESTIERVFAMINHIDWISFYLAIMYKTNPSPVENIMKLKSLMMD